VLVSRILSRQAEGLVDMASRLVWVGLGGIVGCDGGAVKKDFYE
jgi:hypothetical protein